MKSAKTKPLPQFVMLNEKLQPMGKSKKPHFAVWEATHGMIHLVQFSAEVDDKGEAAYLKALNATKVGGRTDWIAPNDHQECAIVDRDFYDPAIDPKLFPGTPSAWFRTSKRHKKFPSYVWFVGFGYGVVSNGYRDGTGRLRAVCGPVPRPGQ